MVRPEYLLDSWKTVRADTIAALEEFPADKLDLNPAEGLMTVRQMATHILHAGYGITGIMLDGSENLQTPDFRDLIMKHAAKLGETPDAPSLAAALRKSVEEQCERLATQSAEWFAHVITRFDGQRVTRLELVMMVKEHELTHRSQMFVAMRLQGAVPPTTRRRLAAQKK